MVKNVYLKHLETPIVVINVIVCVDVTVFVVVDNTVLPLLVVYFVVVIDVYQRLLKASTVIFVSSLTSV